MTTNSTSDAPERVCECQCHGFIGEVAAQCLHCMPREELEALCVGLSDAVEGRTRSLQDIRADLADQRVHQQSDGEWGAHGNWPLPDVLTKLADAVEHLLKDHDCDMHGYEQLSYAIPAARWYATRAHAPVVVAEP